jgi:antitoxin HicB
MRTFLYPAILTPDSEQGGFVVTFPDIPEAITQGDGLSEALQQAADGLDEAIAGRIRRHEPIPEVSMVRPHQYAIALPIATGLKAALYLALEQPKVSQSELAAYLDCDEQEVSRLLDPRRTANVSRLEAALRVLGYQLVLGMQPIIIPPCSGPAMSAGNGEGFVTPPPREEAIKGN